MKQLIIAATVLIGMSSCSGVAGWFGSESDSSEYAAKAYPKDVSITRENAYSDLFLDSAAVDSFISKENLSGDQAQQIRNFYNVRNDQFAWFTSQGLTEQARGFWSVYGSNWGAEKGLDESVKRTMDSLVAGNASATANMQTNTAARNTTATNNSGGTASQTATAGTASATNATTGSNTYANNRVDSGKANNDTSAYAQTNTSVNTMNFNASDSNLVRTELYLTRALMDYVATDSSVITASNVYYVVPARKIDPMQYADSVLNKSDSSAFANNPTYKSLKQQLALYYQAAKNGGWPTVSATNLKKGSQSAEVAALKKRLQVTNDYPQGDTSSVYNGSLANAVKSVQQQFGLQPTGNVNDSLVTALNVPVEERMQQIILNMNRAIWMQPVNDSSWVEVNIPSQMLYAYRNGNRVLEMPVIVGDEGTSTIAFSGNISQVVFNPDWNIPRSIVENEIMPAMKNDPNYLQKHNMEMVNGNNGGVPQIRQKPGKDNALGRVKFLFPNRYDIYLHDTPDKSKFQQSDRRISHGCIRVADAQALAQFVLDSSEWNADKINTAINNGQQQSVNVKQPKPVQINYLTAWVAPNGKMNFRDDVYGHDQQAMAMMFNRNTMQNNMATTPDNDSTRKQTTTP